jgi:hypothetical protein
MAYSTDCKVYIHALHKMLVFVEPPCHFAATATPWGQLGRPLDNHRGIQLNACRGCHERDRMVVVQSVHMTIKVVSSAPSWLGVLDTTLCDKSLAVCVVFCRPLCVALLFVVRPLHCMSLRFSVFDYCFRIFKPFSRLPRQYKHLWLAYGI